MTFLDSVYAYVSWQQYRIDTLEVALTECWNLRRMDIEQGPTLFDLGDWRFWTFLLVSGGVGYYVGTR